MVPKKGRVTYSPWPSAVKRKNQQFWFKTVCCVATRLAKRNTPVQRMRIIGGNAAGKTLKVPKGLGVRPTPDKVRLAIFNSLGGFVENARILEVFAGTGALGLEALSRGAASAVFVELSSKHARVMRENHKSVEDSLGQAVFWVEDAFTALGQLREGAVLDLVAVDLRIATNAIGEIVGKTTTEDLLDSIFSTFCIGK